MRALPLLLFIACSNSATTGPSDAGNGADGGSVNDGGGAQDGGNEDAGVVADAPRTIGGSRPARVTYPANFDPAERWPMVLVLHGYSASGAIQDSYLGVSARADAMGFVTVAPDGLSDPQGNRYWNATGACCDFAGAAPDDVGYLSDLIDEAVARASVDPERVVVIGHSNGGYMANRLACDAADKISAVLSLAGMGFVHAADCQPSRPVSYIHAHGTLDATVLYGGGQFGAMEAYPGVDDHITAWRTRNGCAEEDTQSQANYDNGVMGDETEITEWSCGGTTVARWKIVGGGHIPSLTNAFRDDALATLLGLTRP